MQKLSSGIQSRFESRKWQSRYFALTDTALLYYPDKSCSITESNGKAVMLVQDISAVKVVNSNDGVEIHFCSRTAKETTGTAIKPYILKTDSLEHAEAWQKAVHAVRLKLASQQALHAQAAAM